MAVSRYKFKLLELSDCPIVLSLDELEHYLKTHRNGQETSETCYTCKEPIYFGRLHFSTCCNKFYYKPETCYPVTSIAIRTPGYTFILHELKVKIFKKSIVTNQDFLVIPDPIYWQIKTTLILNRIIKFVKGIPLSKKNPIIQPPSKSLQFYNELQKAPLNHGSIHRRSGGKNSNYRQWSFGKRVRRSCRAMIVPAPHLRPNEIAVPKIFDELFHMKGKWVLINRMPSLQPENVTALRVVEVWEHDCIGLLLEVVKGLNGDFDGDEVNGLIGDDPQSQAELATLMDTRYNMGSFNLRLKLSPSQDMLVAYYLFYDEIDFLPYKDRTSLTKTFQVIYDLYGSETCFECMDRMRQFYLEVLEDRVAFGITLEEINFLVESARNVDYETFCHIVRDSKGCLVTQVCAEAKGSLFHLYQMFGSLGIQGEFNVDESYFAGLTPPKGVAHAITTYVAMVEYNRIWEPGYTYSKSMYNLQGLTVNNVGWLMDGKTVVAKDVMDVMYYMDLMSKDAFRELIRTVLCREESKGKKRKSDDEESEVKKRKLEHELPIPKAKKRKSENEPSNSPKVKKQKNE